MVFVVIVLLLMASYLLFSYLQTYAMPFPKLRVVFCSCDDDDGRTAKSGTTER